MQPTRAEIDPIVDILKNAKRVLAITGAGISADSGLPTYRGVGGLYDDQVTDDGIAIEDALSGPMFRRRPELTWKHIRQIEEACRDATPNDGHRVLADWEDRFEVCVLTQNVDGFHRAAGSSQVIDIHGDTRDLYCPVCTWQDVVENYAHLAPVPTCPQCGAVIRPRVVLFGEMLDPLKLAHLFANLERGFDVVFSIGTSALFPYIMKPVVDARQAGVPTVEINPRDTDLSGIVTHRVRTGAAAALSAIAERLDG